jgi:hypothetical protein
MWLGSLHFILIYKEKKIMSKGSNAAKANKSDKSRSAREGHGQGWGVKPNKTGGRYKKGSDKKVSAGNDKAFDNIKKSAAGNKSKSGCLPKVFTMFMLFTVVGTYLFLS